MPWHDATQQANEECDIRSEAKVSIEEGIREWDYGHYEGMTSKQIQEERKAKGVEGLWDIWRDGCPGGE